MLGRVETQEWEADMLRLSNQGSPKHLGNAWLAGASAMSPTDVVPHLLDDGTREWNLCFTCKPFLQCCKATEWLLRISFP